MSNQAADPAAVAEAQALARVATQTSEKLEKGSFTGTGTDLTVILSPEEDISKEELDTLRHVPDRLPLQAWFVVVVEFAERWSYYGTAVAFPNYIRADLPPGSVTGAVPADHRADGVAGALGRGQLTAYALTTFNRFWVYLMPVVGGIVADTKLGRYNAIMFFSVICLLGHIMLTLGAIPPSLRNPNGALGIFVVALVIMGVGTGGVKSNVSPMIAEQYTGKLRKHTLASGETVILDPALTYQSIYLWFYAAINVGALGQLAGSFIARDVGFWAAYAVPTIIFLLVPGVLVIGRNKYIKTPPRGSILIETWRVFSIAASGKWTLNPVALFKRFYEESFWDSAKPSMYEQRPPKITWDDEFVEEVARTFKACKVFMWYPIYWLCYSQMDNNLSTQSAAMLLQGTPNDLISNLNPISIVIMIPIFERLIYPGLRRIGINFTPIKRIYAGFIVAAIAMAYCAALQHYIYAKSPCHNNLPSECERENGFPDPARINVWAQGPVFILIGMSEIFASITGLEYAFTKAPARMKGVVMSFYLLQNAFSSALNYALLPVNTEEKFAWVFGATGVATLIAGTIFFISFRQLDRDEARLNAIGTSGRAGFIDEAEIPPRHATSEKH